MKQTLSKFKGSTCSAKLHSTVTLRNWYFDKNAKLISSLKLLYRGGSGFSALEDMIIILVKLELNHVFEYSLVQQKHIILSNTS